MASAHLGHVVRKAERYLKVDLSKNEARFVVSLNTGSNTTFALMEAADANGDGEVTEEESNTYLDKWGIGLLEQMPIEVDGVVVPVEWDNGYFHPLGKLAATDGVSEMSCRIPIEGEVVIRWRDKMLDDSVERTDVSVVSRDGASLLDAALSPPGLSGKPAKSRAAFTFFPKDNTDEVQVKVSSPAKDKSEKRTPMWLAVGALLVVLSLVLLWTRRRGVKKELR